MNKDILNTGIQQFIKNNITTDIMSVVTSKPLFDKVDNKEIAQQIQAAKACQKKLPTWFNTPGIYYPKKINIEQTSSEITALYKSNLISGDWLVDLTGGFGVDDYYFSKKFSSVVHIEIDSELSEIAKYNFNTLNKTNITSLPLDGITYLKNTENTFSWIYLDPSRRDENKRKVFLFEDCTPNIVEELPLLFSKSDNVLIKTAPLYDIQKGIEELKGVKEIHIVAVENEVKELLWVLEKEFNEETRLIAVNLETTQDEFCFIKSDETKNNTCLSQPQQYLYEPNAAILKAGAFKSITHRYRVSKLHTNSHLYTSNELIEFPGRRFKVINTIDYNKKNLKNYQKTKANISCRNFKVSVAELRKKHQIADGGATYLFFTTDLKGQSIVVECERLSQ